MRFHTQSRSPTFNKRQINLIKSILYERIYKFKLGLALKTVQRRFIFLLPGVDDIDTYIKQKIKYKEKQKKLKIGVTLFRKKSYFHSKINTFFKF